MASVVRPGFEPVAERGDPSGRVAKIGGRPWLPEGEAWPTCIECRAAFSLWLQLDLAALPAGAIAARGGGLLQVFACTNLDAECEGFGGDEWTSLTRVIPVSTQGSTAARDLAGDRQTAYAITGWTRFDTCPTDDGDWDEVVPDVDEAVRELVEAHVENWGGGEQLGGWPQWMQGPKFAACPACGDRMEHVFEFGSDVLLDWVFGDFGVGYLQRCPRHPGKLALIWQCT